MKTTRKLLLSALIIAVCCAVMATQVYAEDNVCGDNLTWSYDSTSKTLIISGTGDMYDYTSHSSAPLHSSAPWDPFNDSAVQNGVTSIIVQNGVTSIGDYAFNCFDDLTSVQLPEGLHSIGSFAFTSRRNLSLTIPSSVVEIGEGAFTDVKLSVSPDNEFFCIAGGLLMDTAQTKVISNADPDAKLCIIPDSVTEISPYAFYMCSGRAGLEEILIPSGVTEIKEHTFDGCWGLTYIHLPEGLKRIGDYAFAGCRIPRIVLPASVESVGKAFGDRLEQLCFMGDAPEFEAYDNSLSEDLVLYYIPTKSGWSSGWNGYTTSTWSGNLDDLDTFRWSLTNGVLTISDIGKASINSADQAPWWYRRAEVTNMVIEEGITELDSFILDDLPNLRTLALPSTFTDPYFHSNAVADFADLHSLKKITVTAGNTAYASENGALLNSDKTELICVPQAMEGSFTIPSSVTTVGYNAFSNCAKLTEIVVPDSVSKWGYSSSFSVDIGCDSLRTFTVSSGNETFTSQDGVLFDKEKTELLWFPAAKTGIYEIPAGVTHVCSKSFFHSSISELHIPPSVTSLGLGSTVEATRVYTYFDGCQNLTAIHVDAANTAYCSVDGVLYNKDMTKLLVLPNDLAEYAIPDSITSAYASSTPKGLTSLFIGENATSVRFEAFADLMDVTVHEDNLNYYVIDDVVYSRDGKTLYWCPRDYKGVFSIPEGVTTIATSAFQNCTELTDVEFPDSLSVINRRAFAGCTGLTELQFCTPGLRIYSGAFIACTGLEKVIFDTSVTVNSFAFADCYALSEIEVSSDCSIMQNAFAYCENLEKAVYPGAVPVTLLRGSYAKCSADFALYYTAGTPGWQNPLRGYPTIAVSTCDQDGHNVVIDHAVEPKVGEDGLTEGAHCSACGAILTAQEPVPALISAVVFDDGILTLYVEEQLPQLFVAAYDTTGRMAAFHIAVWDGTKYTVASDTTADEHRWLAFCLDNAFAPLSCAYDLTSAK